MLTSPYSRRFPGRVQENPLKSRVRFFDRASSAGQRARGPSKISHTSERSPKPRVSGRKMAVLFPNMCAVRRRRTTEHAANCCRASRPGAIHHETLRVHGLSEKRYIWRKNRGRGDHKKYLVVSCIRTSGVHLSNPPVYGPHAPLWQ